MDKQVQLAMAKWPNVPHCYGWLALDARGAWRMRDQRAQDLGLPGSKITNAILRGFIDRNYLADEEGRYFFQNGPQRVYVELQATPYIAHSDPALGWVVHTGQVLSDCHAVWMTATGNLILQSASYLAQIDDHDMAVAVTQLHVNGIVAGDEQILAWLDSPDESLTFLIQDQFLPVRFCHLEQLSRSQHFVVSPFASQITG
jgi:hypothetical protein